MGNRTASGTGEYDIFMKWGIERLQELESITSPGTGEYNVFRNRSTEHLRQELVSITSV